MLLVSEVTKATSAKAALDHLQQTHQSSFDLVVTDLDLPDMDGFEFLDVIHETIPDTLVVVTLKSNDFFTVWKLVELHVKVQFKPISLGQVRHIW
ncbi:hypothetical protein Droror1_Dr00023351, partial [Drosera rotundifolia]